MRSVDLTVKDGASISAREKYDRYGVIHVPGVLTKSEIDEIRDSFTSYAESSETIAKDHPKGGPENDILQKFPRLIQPHRYPIKPGQLSLDYMLDSRIWNIVENLIGMTYGAQSMFYFKPPNARGQALHQDNYFLQAHPETCLAAWIAVDDSDNSNGGLKVIPGSHKNEILCHGSSDLKVSFSPHAVILPEEVVVKDLLVDTDLKAGDVLFFHGSLVHGSDPNNSDRFRRALIFHYCPQASKKIFAYYQPLVNLKREDVFIDESDRGGPCGERWTMHDDAKLPEVAAF